jgi:hypothetical protein
VTTNETPARKQSDTETSIEETAATGEAMPIEAGGSSEYSWLFLSLIGLRRQCNPAHRRDRG